MKGLESEDFYLFFSPFSESVSWDGANSVSGETLEFKRSRRQENRQLNRAGQVHHFYLYTQAIVSKIPDVAL